ncbi:AbrB/MazE/SpoVT family DNA-binding domain-containing protein [Elusimicrobiota bacterium]
MLRKIGQSYQIALPQALIHQMGLKIKDYLDVYVKEGKIILEPQVIVPRDQAYFYTKEWQKEEQQASEDIRKGRVTKTKNAKDLVKKLRR